MSALTKRMSSLLKRNTTPVDLAQSLEKKEAPEVRAPRLIKEFCDASSENSSAADEVIYLPYIRESVEAKPAAAKAAVKALGKYIGSSQFAKPGALYNAVMLLRILADSPGPAFTQHIDERFVGSTRLMLKNCNKQEPQLILQQTLEYFQREKAEDQNLAPMITMWQSQKNEWSSGFAQRDAHLRQQPVSYQQLPQQQAGHHHPRAIHSLPPPQELAERIAEAETSVQLLTQFLQTTPLEELLGNELIREFTNRCKSARDSMQAYIDCQNPEPDGDTLMTLVQTQQRISAVLNKRNVAMSQAKAAYGGDPSPAPTPSAQPGLAPAPAPAQTAANPNEPPVHTRDYATGVTTTSGSAPPQVPKLDLSTSDNPASRLQNPFDDSNQIGTNGERSPAGRLTPTGTPTEARQRPALSVNTSYTRRQQPSPKASTANAPTEGNTANGAATNGADNGEANGGIERSRFRVV